ncbi:MAG: protein kinase [Phycisphaerales bacterium]
MSDHAPHAHDPDSRSPGSDPTQVGPGGPGVAPASPRPEWMTESPGMLIGPYRLIEIVGEGGFGTVWKAERREPIVQIVALKIIRAGMGSREVVARFEQERQALAMMDHPGLARIFDAGAAGPELGYRPYFVMEFVPGRRITEYCDERSLSLRGRLSVFAQVCRAVGHAHACGIIHRDLKPGNVLVRDAAAGGPEQAEVKVIDFGIAKALAPAGLLTERTLHTEAGRLMGTPEYMSPEQAGAGVRSGGSPAGGGIDGRADVFSLGALLYELLVGSPPRETRALRGMPLMELQRVIREVEIPAPARRFASLPPAQADGVAARRGTDPPGLARALRGELEWIALKAMHPERSGRYQHVTELAADVERLLAGVPVMAAPPSMSYQVRKRTLALLGRRGAAAGAWLDGALVAFLGASLLLPGAAGLSVQWAVQEVQSRLELFDIGGDPFQHVRMVRITDKTDPEALARQEFLRPANADGAEPDRAHTLRFLHTRLLDRLAAAGVRAAAFDIQFKSRSEYDEQLALRADAGPGMAVCFATNGWGGEVWRGSDERPRGARVGGVTINYDEELGNIDAEIALMKLGSAGAAQGYGSLALEAFAAAGPGARVPRVRPWDDTHIMVETGARAPVLVSCIVLREEADRAGLGIEGGDLVAFLPVFVPSDADLEAASMDYAWALSASPAELSERLKGRVVVIGDDTDARDRYHCGEGRRVGGFAVQAQTIEALIRAFGWRTAAWADGLLAAAGAGLGMVWMMRRPRRPGRWAEAAAAGVGALGLFCASMAMLHAWGILTNPLAAWIGMLVTMAIAGWLGLHRRDAE